MDLRILNDLPISMPAPKPQGPQSKTDSGIRPGLPVNDQISIQTSEARASIRTPSLTRLVSEQREEIGNGVRMIRTFEQPDGRTFTRAEEILLTKSGARRTVVQQNPSGGITRYEEVLDREGNGTFRRTQRFQDEAGDVATQISNGYHVRDPFILTGSGYPTYPSASTSFQPMRGTQLDLRA